MHYNAADSLNKAASYLQNRESVAGTAEKGRSFSFTAQRSKGSENAHIKQVGNDLTELNKDLNSHINNKSSGDLKQLKSNISQITEFQRSKLNKMQEKTSKLNSSLLGRAMLVFTRLDKKTENFASKLEKIESEANEVQSKMDSLITAKETQETTKAKQTQAKNAKINQQVRDLYNIDEISDKIVTEFEKKINALSEKFSDPKTTPEMKLELFKELKLLINGGSVNKTDAQGNKIVDAKGNKQFEEIKGLRKSLQDLNDTVEAGLDHLLTREKAPLSEKGEKYIENTVRLRGMVIALGVQVNEIMKANLQTHSQFFQESDEKTSTLLQKAEYFCNELTELSRLKEERESLLEDKLNPPAEDAEIGPLTRHIDQLLLNHDIDQLNGRIQELTTNAAAPLRKAFVVTQLKDNILPRLKESSTLIKEFEKKEQQLSSMKEQLSKDRARRDEILALPEGKIDKNLTEELAALKKSINKNSDLSSEFERNLKSNEANVNQLRNQQEATEKQIDEIENLLKEYSEEDGTLKPELFQLGTIETHLGKFEVNDKESLVNFHQTLEGIGATLDSINKTMASGNSSKLEDNRRKVLGLIEKYGLSPKEQRLQFQTQKDELQQQLATLTKKEKHLEKAIKSADDFISEDLEDRLKEVKDEISQKEKSLESIKERLSEVTFLEIYLDQQRQAESASSEVQLGLAGLLIHTAEFMQKDLKLSDSLISNAEAKYTSAKAVNKILGQQVVQGPALDEDEPPPLEPDVD